MQKWYTNIDILYSEFSSELAATEEANMAVSYKRLWKLLIDKDMKKKDLEDKAKISHYTVNKMNRGDNITTDIIQKICLTLKCTPDEIMEIIPDEPKENCES